MEHIFAFHGTPCLSQVLEAGEIQCPSLMEGEFFYQHHLRQYDELTRNLAEAVKKELRNGGGGYDHFLNQTNRTDAVLADMAVMNPMEFEVTGEEIHEYKELRRGVHVFFAQYACASSYAKGHDQAVIEVLLSSEMIDNNVNGGWSLVRRAVGLDKATGIFVPKYRMRDVRKASLKNGYAMRAKEMQGYLIY